MRFGPSKRSRPEHARCSLAYLHLLISKQTQAQAFVVLHLFFVIDVGKIGAGPGITVQ